MATQGGTLTAAKVCSSGGRPLTRISELSCRAVTQQQLYVGVFLVLFANGALLRAFDAADLAGPDRWFGAAMNTFGISVIVWAALWLGARFLLSGPNCPVSVRDAVVCTAAVGVSLLPSALPAWAAMTGLAVYVAFSSPPTSPHRRGAWILLALTVPMCWSRLVFSTFSEKLLGAEAAIIGSAMGTPYDGNLVQFADGSGYMEVWPACSSFANVSLAFLCWITFSQAIDHKRSLVDIAWCMLACSAVVAINVLRISLIGYFPQYYDVLHGSVGMSAAGWLTLAASAGVCALGVGYFRRGSQPALVVRA